MQLNYVDKIASESHHRYIKMASPVVVSAYFQGATFEQVDRIDDIVTQKAPDDWLLSEVGPVTIEKRTYESFRIGIPDDIAVKGFKQSFIQMNIEESNSYANVALFFCTQENLFSPTLHQVYSELGFSLRDSRQKRYLRKAFKIRFPNCRIDNY